MLAPLKRSLLLLAGLLSLVLALIGVFLPLLPTVPFLLLAAYCFSQSSARLHTWLLSHPKFGAFIQDWQQHGVISLKAKRLATLSMLVMVSYPIVFVIRVLWLKCLLAITIACVLAFIWTRPSSR